MSEVSFLFYQDEFDTLGAEATPVLVANLTAEENHELKNTYTNFPVENGKNISDHSKREPLTFSMSVIITGTKTDLIGEFGQVNAPYPTDHQENIDAQKRVIQQAFEDFRSIMDSKEKKLFTVVHSLGFYKNMVIESVSVPRNPDQITYAVFSLRFREIEIASLQLTSSPHIAVKSTGAKQGANKQGQKKVDAGKQSTQNKSLAAKWRDGDIGFMEYMTGGLKAGMPGID